MNYFVNQMGQSSCPLTEETDDIFNDDAFEKMKSSAILINTARGG